MKETKCIIKKIKRRCFKNCISIMKDEIKAKEVQISKIDEKQYELNKIISKCSLEEILKLEIVYLNKDDIEYKYMVNENLKRCKLNPCTCELEEINIENKLKSIKEQVIKKINLHNDDLNVIEKIKKLHLDNYKETKDIYFKFKRDKEGNLTLLYFDIDNFIEEGLGTIYLCLNDKISIDTSVLHLKYERHPIEYSLSNTSFSRKYGYVLICDFISRNIRLGHGTYMISNLEPIIKKVNNKINRINKYIDYDDRTINEIIAINGMVCPGTCISFEDLVKFYNKNGYPTFKNDRYIYKEI